MVAPLDRAFPTARRGQIRDEILESFRYWLRQQTDPATGLLFDEPTVQAATAELTRFFIDADAEDIVLLAAQARALFLVDQVNPQESSGAWLTERHGGMWGLGLLPASGGSGPINAVASAGTTFIGSATVPDAVAHKCVINGITYQVLFTTVTPASGIASLTVQALSTGTATNVPINSVGTWSPGPGGAAPEGITVTAGFTGGAPIESHEAFARRLISIIRDRPAAGNNAQFRAWAREASTAVEDAFVYACALQAGSVRVAVTQKRSGVSGPFARIASAGTILAATSYLTPPASPVVPTPPHVVVTGTASQPSNVVVNLSTAVAAVGGWTDRAPWPGNDGSTYAYISALTDQLNFKVTRPSGSIDLPSGLTPSLMVWNDATSRFEKLDVASITLDTGDVFDVVLNAAPSKTLVAGAFGTGDVISPDHGRRDGIAEAVEAFFDSLGPGELVDLASSPLAHRAYRYPPPNQEWSQRVGETVLSFIRDSLGAAVSDQSLGAVTVTVPTVPTDANDEPNLVTLNKLGIYLL